MSRWYHFVGWGPGQSKKENMGEHRSSYKKQFPAFYHGYNVISYLTLQPPRHPHHDEQHPQIVIQNESFLKLPFLGCFTVGGGGLLIDFWTPG